MADSTGPFDFIKAGAVLALLLVVFIWLVAEVSINKGRQEVIQHCADYKAYAMEGTQKLLCSVATTPELPASTLTEEQYSKENKDKHRKDRK